MAQAAKAKKSSVKIDKTYYEGVGRRRTASKEDRDFGEKGGGTTTESCRK